MNNKKYQCVIDSYMNYINETNQVKLKKKSKKMCTKFRKKIEKIFTRVRDKTQPCGLYMKTWQTWVALKFPKGPLIFTSKTTGYYI